MLRWDMSSIYRLEDVYHSVYMQFAYDLLKERLLTPDVNISHKYLPTWEDHVYFVGSKPYRFYDVIHSLENPNECIGVVYYTHKQEIGIHIANKYQRQGYAREVLKFIAKTYYVQDMYANINPKNEASIKLFESLGFKPCQVTMKLDRS